MWLGILAAVLAATGAGAAYMIACVGRYGFVRKLAGEKKLLRHLISALVIAVFFAAVSLTLSAVNAVIVFLHFVLVYLLFGGITRIFCAATGRDKDKSEGVRKVLQGIIAPVFTIGYLAVGMYLVYNVWQTDVSLTTKKPVGTLKVALFADSHLGTTFGGEGFAEHMERINAQDPDIVLLAGDYVDDGTDRDDMIRACEALGAMDAKYGVWYCYGNHDEGYFNRRNFTAADLEENLRKNGVHILADEYELVGDSLCIVGRKDRSDPDRMAAGELINGLPEDRYIIVLDHQPADYAAEADTPADLVVSGHTHGGQLFPITYVGEWIGANDRTYGHEQRNGTDFLVTSGISDWEIKFKTGTKSEYMMINIEQQ